METKFSKEKFDGYTHVFRIKITTTNGDTRWLLIYSNTDNQSDIIEFLENKKSSLVASLVIDEVVTKEQEEITTEFITEFLESL